jgi:uncharacterized membrane protein (DUF485 family)
VKRVDYSVSIKGIAMSDLDHRPAVGATFEPQHISARNARIGLVLFCAYFVFYGLFVAINTFRPELMDAVPAAGLNLAVWYGFALILAAFILALVYAWLCRSVAVAKPKPAKALPEMPG